MAEIIPIFPLDLVLFPGATLPLHIFEPRYKEMIGECLSQEKHFGIIRTVDERVAQTGCTAKIVNVLKKYDDGRMNIMAEGIRRFEVEAIHEDRAFLQATVGFFDDESTRVSADDRRRALELCRELLTLGNASDSFLEEEHPQLSFQIAGPMPLELDLKQSLLAMRSESQRLNTLSEYFEELLPRLYRALKARGKAGGNGHAVN